MPLRPPPPKDDPAFDDWCEELFRWARYPHFDAFRLVPQSSDWSDTSEGVVYAKDSANIMQYYNGTQFIDVPYSTSTSYSDVLMGFGYWVDASEADQGAAAAAGSDTMKDLADSIGTGKTATLMLTHDADAGNTTQYTLTTSLDLSSYPNLYIRLSPGAFIDGAGTLTVYSPENIIAGPKQKIFGSSLTVNFSVLNGWVSPFYWGAVNDPGDDTTDSGEEIQAAIDTGANVRIPAGTYSTDSAIVQNNSDQTVEAWGVTLRVNADVIGWQIGVTGGGSNVNRANLIGDLKIQNVSGASTKAGIRLESLTYSQVHAYFISGFNYGVEPIASGALGCVYNDVYAKYINVNDGTDGRGIYFNHVDDVVGYVFNNIVHHPIITGTTLYDIDIQYRSSGATSPHPTNNVIIAPVFSTTTQRNIRDDGNGTVVRGGHYESTLNNSVSIDTATYQWTQVGASAEYYLELNGGGNPWIAANLGVGVFLNNGHTVKESGVALTWGASGVGSLAQGEFAWGDPDANGWNTLVVRTSDDAQPTNNEITFIDPNPILADSNSTTSQYIIPHSTLTGVTNKGTYHRYRTRQEERLYFQDGNTRQTALWKRVGVQAAKDTSPMFELYDSASGSGFSQVLLLRAGRTDADSWFLRMLDGSDNVKGEISADGRAIFNVKGIVTQSSNQDTANPPTNAELNTAFGTASAVGDGFIGLLDDAGSGNNVYIIASDGTNWWHLALTKAV